jgi:hypothetical protein
VRFVKFMPQAGYPAPGHHSGMTLHTPGAPFGRFHLLGYLVDVGVQRLQQLPRLRRIGVIDHVGIIASTTATRAPRPCLRGIGPALAAATVAQ